MVVRSAGVLFVCAALTVPGVSPAQAQGRARGQVPARAAAAPKITWKRCAEDRTARCGRLSVPIDWDRPGRGRIGIAVTRVKATKKRLGVLLVNPGGPGGSGVDFALDRAGLSRQVRERYDIVGFDPRGVGASHAVRCGKTGKPARRFPRNEREFRKLKAYQAKLYKACRKKTGPLYDFLGAGGVARDMDMIRAALGVRQVSVFARSYGTWIGQRYAELFPGRVRAMVLDGAMDHGVRGAQAFSVDEARGLEAGYAQFAAWCRTSRHCALRGRDAVDVLDGLMARARKGRLHEIGEPRVRLGVPGLAQMVRTSMYDPISWAQLGEELRELARQKNRAVKGKAAAAPGPDGLFAGILCQDWSFPVRDHAELTAVMKATRRAAPHVRFNPLGHEAITACLGRPKAAADPQRPYRIRTPLLVVGGTGDPATVHPWAVGVQRSVPGSALLTYRGAGHGAYGLSGCARKAIDAYLLNGTMPAAGAECPAVPPDFGALRLRNVPDEARRW
ncbi:alpha/beta hydrolase [Spirillospora sp. NPDC047279]|uniref:alpha/beta hydrolase n=1 Tax=Spirillospora sp. NPDC047279 TaxID=3155478 RepID=UPI0033D59CDA